MVGARLALVTGLLLTAAVFLPACGTSGAAAKRDPAQVMGRLGASKAEPYPTCGPRDSYRFVAEDFVCPDGGNPFRGDARAAGRARLGNVGSHLREMPKNLSESHIVDHYLVPCASGDVDVFVCMYHCRKP